MTSRTIRKGAGTALALWLVVAGYAVREMIVAEGDDWQLAYAVFAAALPIGAALTVALLGSVTSPAGRSAVRIAGLAVSVLGCAFGALVAWALPIWMTLLAVGFALLAAAATGPTRRSITLLAAASGCGVATQFTLLAVGVRDGAAADVALLVAATATALALGSGLRLFSEHARVDDVTAPGGVVPAKS